MSGNNGFSMQFVKQNTRAVIVLDRIVEGVEPEYCTHGKTRCMICNSWCHLGDQSLDEVLNGRARPWCHECAIEHLSPQNAVLLRSVRDGRHGR